MGTRNYPRRRRSPVSPSASPSTEEKSKENFGATPEQQERFERERKRKETKLEQARARAAARPLKELEHLYELVGKETGLLPASPRKKHPELFGAQKITLKQTLKEGYRAELRCAAAQGNVCARLGELSGGLLTIDLDIDAPDLAQATYAALCKSFEWVSQTLTTQGRPNRRQIWFRAIGDYPRDRGKLILKSTDGTLLGELRNGEGDQWQSVLSGIHPDTLKHYRVLIEKPVQRVHFPFEGWPEEIAVNWNHSAKAEEKTVKDPPGWDEASAAASQATPGASASAPTQSSGGDKDQWWRNYDHGGFCQVPRRKRS